MSRNLPKSVIELTDEALTKFRGLEAKSASYGNRVLRAPNCPINVWGI